MSAHNTAKEMFDRAAETPDPGNGKSIRIDESPVVCNIRSAGVETRTLPVPLKQGAIAALHFAADSGDVTVTVTGGYNEDGDTTFVFSDAGQFIVFMSFFNGTTHYWRKISDYGLGNATPGESGIAADLTATAAEINASADVSGRLVSIPDDTTYTVLAANSGKPHVLPDLSASCTLSLPAPASGLEYEFIYGGVAADAQNWVFDTGSDTNFYVGGLLHADTDAGDAGDEIVPIAGDGNSNSKLTVVTPDVGTRVKMISDGTLWILAGYVVSATVPSFADQT